jgi:DNA repair photolyase
MARMRHNNNTGHKGRGALSNPPGRFDQLQHAGIDDGWFSDESRVSPSTQPLLERAKTIITQNSSPDVPFDKSVNPYRGCEQGCIYCFARPSHAYWDMSSGLDFETKIVIKENAAALLERELNKPNYRCQPIALGVNTDAWQPLEKERKITRSILRVLQKYQHPFTTITKSSLILRDLDIIADMASHNLCSVGVSLTTLSDDLKRKMEPRAASPSSRLRVIETLANAGVSVTVLVAPVIPAINDKEMEDILSSSLDAGARRAAYILIRMPHEIEDLFQEWLRQHFPDRKDHVMSLIYQCRGGKAYQSEFGLRMTGSGKIADLIGQRFRIACRRLGMNQGARLELSTDLFRGDSSRQLSLWAR